MNYFKCSDYPFNRVKELWKATGKTGCLYGPCKALRPSCPEALSKAELQCDPVEASDAVIMILE